ncbi:MAG: alpha-L-fucosidase [Pirellulales bacterium]
MQSFSVRIAGVLKSTTAAVLLLTAAASGVAAEPAPPPPHGATPSPQQLAWHDREFYAFVHFNMNTFTGVEWGHGSEAPQKFNPTQLDCRQWCALFKECGLSGVIITAKHHDGFCLWPSRYTEHDVANSPWRGGKGDVVRELADACREYGLWLGVYISPWDRNNPIYGKEDAAYNDYFVGQLEELLTNYGPIAEVWWDGANGDRNNPAKHQEYDWPRFIATVRRLQPNAVIFAPPYSPGDIRWVGNEAGRAGATQWSTYPAHVDEDPATLNVGIEGAETWMPAETDVSIRPGWYWTRMTDDRVKSVDDLLDIYYASVGQNTNLLLNFPVDDRGLVPDADARQLRGLAKVLRSTFAVDHAQGGRVTASNVRRETAQFAAANLTDDDPATYWATDDDVTSPTVTIEFQQPAAFNRVVLQEHIALGQRVRAWTLAVRSDGKWRDVGDGTTIGHKRIACFPTVTADAVQLSVRDSRACPVLENIGVFTAPPQVSIEPRDTVFVGATTVTLHAETHDCAIRYTLDGTQPGPNSPLYTGPFAVTESCRVRAVAVCGGEFSTRIASLALTCYQVDQLRPPIADGSSGETGLRVSKYDGGWQTLDQMKDREPVEVVDATGFDLTERLHEEHSALAFEGLLNVPADGIYTFSISSDDGSRLFIGRQLVVDNDGLHPMREKSGCVGLKAGLQPLRVEWFNAGASAGLEVRWQGPQTERQELSTAAIYRPSAVLRAASSRR